MKKKFMLSAALMLTVACVSACGSKTETEGSAEASTEVGTEAAATEGAEQEAPTKTVLDYDLDKLVKLGEYTGITIEATKTEITDEAVESSLKSAYASNPLMKDVTGRKVESGDTVDIDFEGKYADTLEAFEGGTSEHYSLVIGSGSFIDGFEDGLIGVGIGETVDLNLTFPENYQATDLAGKDVVFTVKVNGIKVAEEEPSDEWVASLGLEDAKTLEEYKAQLKEELEADAEEEYKAEVMNQAIEVAVDNATVEEVPEELYNRYSKMVNSSVESYIQQLYYTYGVQTTVDEYITSLMQSNGISGTVEDYLGDIITQQTKRSMIVQAIANKEGIEVSEQEVDDMIRTYYDSYYSQMYSTFEEFKAILDTEDYRETILTDKVAEFLVEKDTVVDAQ
ncbi:trigger factor [Butyrivibrio sp. AE2032]|uniref:trigger factor n=1 Tax=Butyrivibrio sp. AE2032 TaxID=1458463 RepID=UPI00068A6E8F|nr:trigger factor [Butyrivibrio sp. AE2032]